MPDLARATETEGWMTIQDITFLAEQAQSHEKIIDLGTYLGKSAIAMAMNTKGFVLCIDDWWGPRSLDWSEVERSKIFGKFYLNCEDLLLSGKMKYLTHNHTSAIDLDFQPDMVHIDGNHAYDNIRYDILQWSKKLAPGGLLCGHDANYKGVKKALDELAVWHLVPGAFMFVIDEMKQ